MPYIITTRRKITDAERIVVDALQDVGTRVTVNGEPIVSRTAVATLEEAQRDLRLLVSGFYTQASPYTHGQDWSPWRVSNGPSDPDFADVFPESGGTIGPLPDGTIIEVSRVNDPECDGYCDFPVPHDVADHAQIAEYYGLNAS